MEIPIVLTSDQWNMIWSTLERDVQNPGRFGDEYREQLKIAIDSIFTQWVEQT